MAQTNLNQGLLQTNGDNYMNPTVPSIEIEVTKHYFDSKSHVL